MKILRDIVYRKESPSELGMGDLYLPDACTENTPVAMSIHGGGWTALDRRSFAGVAEFLCHDLGMIVWNIEYRLANKESWPACGDDCLSAAHFFRNQILVGYFKEVSRMFVIGASAGGHLALLTGFRMPAGTVSGIISISGIDLLEPDVIANPARYRSLFGQAATPELIAIANPINYCYKNAPPVLLTHAIYDTVVPLRSATDFEEKAKQIGIPVASYYYNRKNDGHCIWIPGSDPHRLYPDIEEKIRDFVAMAEKNSVWTEKRFPFRL